MSNAPVLTPWLVERVRNGEAILFLGAGASYGSAGPKGEKPVNGEQLRNLLSDKFLGGSYKDKPLATVAEYAKNESNLPDVQAYIKTLFWPLEPAPFHQLIPQFRWFAIVTTNYDMVVERAYERATNRLQHLRPIIRDGDDFSTVLRDNTAVPFLKLHGCLTTSSDPNLPLILASEEYAKHRKNRDRLFKHFADWARERPIIFAGYDVADSNIQQILFDLTDLGIHRPMYALVNPSLDAIAVRYWQARRFVPIPSKFEEFLNTLDVEIPQHKRALSAFLSHDPLSIQKWLQSELVPSVRLRAYLENELTHVHPGLVAAGVEPKSFYSGQSREWGAFQQGLDVRRRLTDEVILEAVLDTHPQQQCRLFLAHGHAGSGISVLLKRIAWDSVNDFGALVFCLKEGGVIRPELFTEIAQLTKTPFILIVDDAIPHLSDLLKLANLAKRDNFPLSVLLGARTNEWNVSGQEMDSLIRGEFELKDLTEREIDDLLGKLTTHKALGELASLTALQQREHFRLHVGRQLLVALHEATTGKPFEEIVFDEYEGITPIEAKVLYLDICSLHRLGVPVRAGLVSRVTGITFEYFKEKLFNPLEHVIHTYFDSSVRDIVYRTRHPLIAEFVFSQALPNPIERATQIKRIIGNMDVDYESDKEAFWQLIRGRTLANLFADKAIVQEIFDSAAESGAPEAFVLQQKAIFELNHRNGDMRHAMAAILKAENLTEGRDRAIEHTKSMILRRMALDADHPLEKERFRSEAKQIVKKQQKTTRTSYPFHTYAQLIMDELRDKLEVLEKRSDQTLTDLEERGISELTRQAEESLSVGLQQFPGDQFLLTLDAELAELMLDKPRALESLKRAFTAHPGRALVAVRLARTYLQNCKTEEARTTLETSISANPGSKECHFELARLYIGIGEETHHKEIEYHLKRSFTEGDSNLGAQLLWARHEFVYGNRDSGLVMFSKLADSRTPPQYKKRVQRPILGLDGKPQSFMGYVKAKHDGYCFASCADLRSDVFVPAAQFSDDQWERVIEGSRIRLQVGFTFRGPQGMEPEFVE